MADMDIADTVAATLGASAMVLATQPLDTVKLNVQIQVKHTAESASKHYATGATRGGLWRSLGLHKSAAVARDIVRSRGFASLWAGTPPALYAYGLEHAVLFTVYEAMLRNVEAHQLRTPGGSLVSELATGKALLCAASCGVSSFFLAPADAVKCKIQVCVCMSVCVSCIVFVWLE